MDKVKATDKAAKTIESWWALLFAEGGLGHTAFRWAWPVIGGVVGAWVASATDWISSYGVAGWAATMALGAVSFIWGAVGIDHFRTRGLRAPLGDGLTAAQVEQLINAHFQAREADLAKPLDGALREIRLEICENGNEARMWLAKLEDDIEGKTKGLKQRWDDWTAQYTRKVDRRFENVDAGFKALYHREKMIALASSIDQKAEWLLRPKRGEKIESWSKWENRHYDWMESLNAWLTLAVNYRHGCRERVKSVQPSALQGNWSEPDDLFPDTDTILRYRTMAVVYDNFRKEQAKAHEAVTLAAFHGPSKKGSSES